MSETMGSWRQFIGVFCLGLLVLISALAVVYVKELNRELFIQAEQIQSYNDAAHTEWGELLLEVSAWSTQARVQALAEQKLNMVMPAQKSIVIVKE